VCQLKALVGAGVGLLVVGRTVRGIAGKVGTIVGGGAGKVGMMAGATFGIGKLLSAAVTLLVLYVGWKRKGLGVGDGWRVGVGKLVRFAAVDVEELAGGVYKHN